MMSTAMIAAPPQAPDRKHRWTVADFDRMIAAEIVPEGSRAYLWYGEVLEPMGESKPHANALFGLDEEVPLKLCAEIGGPASEFPAIPVAEILRDSLEEVR